MARAELREHTAERVLHAADRLFAQHTFAGATIREIAQAAGVSVGTVMAVGDKRALLVAVVERRIRAIHEARGGAGGKDVSRAAESAAEPPAARILALFAPFIELFASDIDAAREYAAILVSGSHTSTVFHELADSLTREIAAVVATAGIEDAPTRNATRAIYLAYIGWLFVWAGSGEAQTPPVEELCETIEFVLSRAKG